MDVKVAKRSKPRKRKRHAKVKRREQTTLEVRFPKRRKLGTERHVPHFSKSSETLTNTMQAETFWQNYEAAHEWQRRHSIVWWRSRCNALEQENALLRRKLTDLIPSSRHPTYRESERRDYRRNLNVRKSKPDLEEENSDEEKLEFQVNEDMMRFFEHSIRHKLQLKKEKEIESAIQARNDEADTSIQGGAAWMQAKMDGAKLLYGESSARILAMETALQASIDRHKDRTKPQYWPNIPLNLQTSEPVDISFA